MSDDETPDPEPDIAAAEVEMLLPEHLQFPPWKTKREAQAYLAGIQEGFASGAFHQYITEEAEKRAPVVQRITTALKLLEDQEDRKVLEEACVLLDRALTDGAGSDHDANLKRMEKTCSETIDFLRKYYPQAQALREYPATIERKGRYA